jgi:hypothetical protein
VLGAFLALCLSYGVRYSFGVFVHPMFQETGWPMSVISISASVNILTYSIAASSAADSRTELRPSG